MVRDLLVDPAVVCGGPAADFVLRKPQADLLLSRLHRVGPVNDVAPHVDAVVPAQRTCT